MRAVATQRKAHLAGCGWFWGWAHTTATVAGTTAKIPIAVMPSPNAAPTSS